jgi:hypothetical protein
VFCSSVLQAQHQAFAQQCTGALKITAWQAYQKASQGVGVPGGATWSRNSTCSSGSRFLASTRCTCQAAVAAVTSAVSASASFSHSTSCGMLQTHASSSNCWSASAANMTLLQNRSKALAAGRSQAAHPPRIALQARREHSDPLGVWRWARLQRHGQRGLRAGRRPPDSACACPALQRGRAPLLQPAGPAAHPQPAAFEGNQSC